MIVIQLTSILLIFVLGYLIANLILRNSSVLERISLSYLLGSGIFSYAIFLANWKLGLVLNVYSVSYVAALLIVTTLIIKFIYVKRIGKLNRVRLDLLVNKLSNIDYILIILITVLVGSMLLNNIFWPVTSWDSLTLYDFRAKLIVETGEINSILIDSYYVSHPLFTTLLHLQNYLFGIQNSMYLYSLLYISFIVCFFIKLRRLAGKSITLFTILLFSVNSLIVYHSMYAYTNLPYAIYFSLGILYLYETVNRKKLLIPNYIISALLIGISSWVRYTEPFWIIPLVVAVFIAIKRKKYFIAVTYGLLVYVFRYFWMTFLNSASFNINSVENKITNLSDVSNRLVTRINLNGASELFDYIARYSVWNNAHLWLVFLISILLLYRINAIVKPKIIFQLVVIYGLLLMITLGSYIYYITGTYSNWIQLGDSINRISMIFVPLLAFFTIVNISHFLKNINDHAKNK